MREAVLRLSSTVAVWAVGDRAVERGRIPVWRGVILVPLAAMTGCVCTGVVTCWRWGLSTGRTNVLVAPESRMADDWGGTTVELVTGNVLTILLVLDSTVPDCHSSQKQFFVDPLCMLAKVASDLCPSAGLLHSELVWEQLPCVQQ